MMSDEGRPTKRALLDYIVEARTWLGYATWNTRQKGAGENLDLALTSLEEAHLHVEEALFELQALREAKGLGERPGDVSYQRPLDEDSSPGRLGRILP